MTKDRARRYSGTHKQRDGKARQPRVETPARSKKSSAARAKKRAGAVEVAWDGVRRFAPDAEVRRAARAARKFGKRTDLGLSLVFVSDAGLARLHARHLGDPTHTDVITFDLSDELGGVGGEIYVSAPCARKTARRRGVAARRELLLYVVHGVLHLCGYDDRTRDDRVRMRAAETRVMRALGWKDDPNPHDA